MKLFIRPQHYRDYKGRKPLTWGQCVERVELARAAAYAWEKVAEKTPRKRKG